MKIYNENLKKQFLIDRNFLTMVSTRKFKLQKESQAAYLTAPIQISIVLRFQ